MNVQYQYLTRVYPVKYLHLTREHARTVWEPLIYAICLTEKKPDTGQTNGKHLYSKNWFALFSREEPKSMIYILNKFYTDRHYAIK